MDFEKLFNDLKESAKKYIQTDFNDKSFATLYPKFENISEDEIKQILIKKTKKEQGDILAFTYIFKKIEENIEVEEKTGRTKYNKIYFYEILDNLTNKKEKKDESNFHFNKVMDMVNNTKDNENEEHFNEVIRMINENYENHKKGAR